MEDKNIQGNKKTNRKFWTPDMIIILIACISCYTILFWVLDMGNSAFLSEFSKLPKRLISALVYFITTVLFNSLIMRLWLKFSDKHR